jgi:hypothetical protein
MVIRLRRLRLYVHLRHRHRVGRRFDVVVTARLRNRRCRLVWSPADFQTIFIPNMRVDSSSFGLITQSQQTQQAGPRTIQVMLRLQF